MSLSIGPETRVRIASSVYARAFGEELVLLEFGRGEYFGLDAVGAEVWRGFERGETIGEITDTVVRLWDVSREEALRDIEELVTDMCSRALVAVAT